MKQFVQSLLVGWIALQGLACASADPGAEGNDETTPSAFDIASEDGEVASQANESDSDEAPQGIQLLSPEERDAALDSITAPRGASADAPSLSNLVLRGRLLDASVRTVQVVDPRSEAGGE